MRSCWLVALVAIAGCTPKDTDNCTPTLWYADADADGHGDGNVTDLACTPTGNELATADDCDDADATVHPGATEVCNGKDDNCDGITDTNATDMHVWYQDLDGDTWGGPVSAQACDAPPQFVATLGDCDDLDATVFPGATELCNDKDDNCDGTADEGLTKPTFYADSDADGYGLDADAVDACTAPAGYAATAGDCDDGHDTVNPGETELCGDGLDNDCDGTDNGCSLSGTYDASAGDAEIDGASPSYSELFGYDLAAAGDVDGDGLDDFVISSLEGPTPTKAGADGRAYLAYGDPTAYTGVLAAADLPYVTGESGVAPLTNAPITGVGDVDGDGYDDLLWGTPAYTAGLGGCGGAWLIYGAARWSGSTDVAALEIGRAHV